jgi:hypothetical protein
MKPKTKTKPAPLKPKAGVVKKSPSSAANSERHAVARLEHKDKGDALNSDAVAALYISPNVNAAAAVMPFLKAPFGEVDIASLAIGLEKSIVKVQGGDLKECEAMLMGQAHALQAIFMNLARRGQGAEMLNQYEAHMRLALKAQSQCRATLETLAAIKNPPTVFARQANITTGPQQVNNGTPAPSSAPAGKVETIPNELMEAQDAERLD